MRRSESCCIGILISLVVLLLGAGIAHAQCEIESIGILGSLETEYLASEIVASGSFAYMSTGESHQAETDLQVVDISDPMAPGIVGSVSLPDSSTDLAISGSHVYYVGYATGLYIVDVSDPSAPFVAGSIDMPYGTSVAVSGAYAYVGNELEGLRIINISDPADPRIVGTLAGMSPISAVAVSGSYAYLAGLLDFKVADISDPASPRIVGSTDLAHYGNDMVVVGSYAYLATGNHSPKGGGLDVIDISNPSAPAFVASVQTPSRIENMYPTAVNLEVSGSYAYLTDTSLTVVDISDPAHPFLANHLALHSDPPIWAHLTYDVALSGSHAFVTVQGYHCWPDCADTGYMQVLDVSSPLLIPIVDLFETSHAARDVAISGSLAYTVTGDAEGASLDVIDVSDLNSPSLVGSVGLPAVPWDIEVSGSIAYVGVSQSSPTEVRRLEIVDVSDPVAPAVMGEVDTLNPPYDLAVSGSHVYIASGVGLHVADVADPASAGIVGSIEVAGALSVVVRGNYAYVGCYAGLEVIDVSDPAAPEIVGEVDTLDSLQVIAVSGSHVYTEDRSAIWVIDVSDPTSPYAVTSIDIPDHLWYFEIDGNRVFAVGGGGFNRTHLLMLDISDPLAPYVEAVAQTHDYSSRVSGLAVSGSLAFVTNYDGNLQVVQFCRDRAASPTIALSATSLSATINRVTYSSILSFEIWNSGDGTLAYTLSSDVAWLEPWEFLGGSLGLRETFSRLVETMWLSPGVYTGRITVADPNATNSPQFVDVTLTILPASRTLTTGASPPEGGAVTGGGSHVLGEDAEIQAHPNTGWVFDHWESDDSGVDGSTTNPRSITMDADKAVTAVFVPWIALGYPLNEDAVYGPPTFRWTTQGGTNNVFSVELALSLGGPYYSTYGNLGILIKGDDWVMPYSIWNRIPHGSYIYWRVAGVDLDAEKPAVAYSTEIRFFYKP